LYSVCPTLPDIDSKFSPPLVLHYYPDKRNRRVRRYASKFLTSIPNPIASALKTQQPNYAQTDGCYKYEEEAWVQTDCKSHDFATWKNGPQTDWGILPLTHLTPTTIRPTTTPAPRSRLLKGDRPVKRRSQHGDYSDYYDEDNPIDEDVLNRMAEEIEKEKLRRERVEEVEAAKHERQEELDVARARILARQEKVKAKKRTLRAEEVRKRMAIARDLRLKATRKAEKEEQERQQREVDNVNYWKYDAVIDSYVHNVYIIRGLRVFFQFTLPFINTLIMNNTGNRSYPNKPPIPKWCAKKSSAYYDRCKWQHSREPDIVRW
jgi:hypothetical protein